MTGVVLTILWTFLCYMEGKRDACYYHNSMTSSDPVRQDMHGLYVRTRGLYLLLTMWIYGTDAYAVSESVAMAAVSVAAFGTGLALVFSLIHNGVYYHNRRSLDPSLYPKGFMDSSSTSTAKNEYTFVQRALMAAAGVVLISISIWM